MVWALIFVLSILYNPSSALAEPLEVDSVEDIQEDPESSDSTLEVPSEPSLPPLAAPEPSRGASTIYGSIAPNSSYLEFARDFLPKIPWGDDYVFYRSGQYEYCLAFGDISWSGGRFSGSDCQFIFLTPASGYSTDLTLSSSSGSFSLSPSSYVVYSSLGDFPSLSGQLTFSSSILFLLCVFGICSVLRSIWSFLIRMGVRTHADGS